MDPDAVKAMIPLEGYVNKCGLEKNLLELIKLRAGKEKVTVLLKKALPDVPGHNAMMVTVDFLPGQASLPHKHPGSVFAYVLEGSVISQLEGQKPLLQYDPSFLY